MWLLVRRLGRPPPQLRLYRRLIDDLFLVWIGSRASLNAHLAAINALHPRIRITWTVSDRAADFLDLHIHLGERFYDSQGRADVRIHRKQLNRYLYIPALSFHKRSQHRAWIKAELLRILRNTSSAIDYRRMRRVFFALLRQRGHSVKFLREVFAGDFYQHGNRDSLLSQLQARQDRAYAKAVDVVTRCISTTRDCAMHTMHTSRPRLRARPARASTARRGSAARSAARRHCSSTPSSSPARATAPWTTYSISLPATHHPQRSSSP